MKLYYFTFRSVTWAQRGQRILEKKGISCSLGRASKWMAVRGCGYALKVRKLRESAEALQKDGAVWEKIYVIDENHNRTEVVL